MTLPRPSGWTALLCVVLFAMGGCGTGNPSGDASPSPDAEQIQRFRACGHLVRDIAGSLQTWVDGFEAATDDAGSDEDLGLGSTDVDMAELVQRFAERRARLGCRPREFEVQLTRELQGLEGEGPLTRSLAAAVRSQVLGAAGPPRTIEVTPQQDLQSAVLGAGRGAVVRLAAGTHQMGEPLVLLQSVTIVGTGVDETTIVSRAEGVAIAFVGDGTFGLEDLEVRHTGEAPSSVLVLARGSYRLDGVRLSGGVTDPSATTGYGLVVGAAAADDPDERRVAATEVVDNGAGGIAVVDAAAPILTGLSVHDNEGCGVCYIGGAGGQLTDSRVSGNAVGIALAASANPEVSEVRVESNRTAGVLVEQRATGRLRDLVVTANGTVGILVRGAAGPTLVSPRLEGHEEASIVFLGDSGGRVEAATCAGSPAGIVLIERAAPEVDDGGCEVHDERE